MKRLLFLILVGAVCALGVRHFLIEGIYLASGSMEPTLHVEEHVFVNKWIYFFKKPARQDIVVFKTPQGPDKDLLKRVIAIGGDTIQIKQKKVILNGQPLTEKYVRFTQPDMMFKGDNIDPIQIPNGYLFVMGDNRDESGDSRDWKAADGTWSPYVPVSAIKGRVILLR